MSTLTNNKKEKFLATENPKKKKKTKPQKKNLKMEN